MKSLEELRTQIEKEVSYVDLKPFSHNIISLCLQMIMNDYGKEEANKAVKELGLKRLGWREQK